MSEVATKTKTEVKFSLPPEFKVIYLNDNKTTYEFVIESLMQVFKHSYDKSYELATEIDNSGSAVVAVLPAEIAEAKAIRVIDAARRNGFPLQVKVEPNE